MRVHSSLILSHGPVPSKNLRGCRKRKPQNKENLPPPLGKQPATTAAKVTPKAKKATAPPWRPYMIAKLYASTNATLHDEILAFQNWTMLTRQELDARRIMLNCIKTIVERVFTDAKVELSGSSATSFAFPPLELDIVISTQEVHTDVGKKYGLCQLAAKLGQAKLAQAAVQIPYKDGPLLRLTTPAEYGSFGVDITINNADGLEAVNAVNDYLVSMPALRPLVTVIKALLSKHGLNNPCTGGLSTYAITCMCIFFIKTNPTQRSSSSYDYPVISKSLGTLLSDFLQYFTNEFPYSSSRISANDGKLYSNTDTCCEVDQHCGMSVECLVNPETNLAETVTVQTLQQILDVLQADHADIIKSTTQNDSLLARLVPCEKNVRRRVRRLMESGELEKLLVRLRTCDHGSSITTPDDQSTFDDERSRESVVVGTVDSALGTHQSTQRIYGRRPFRLSLLQRMIQIGATTGRL